MREASERASFRCAFKTSEACVRVVTISVGGVWRKGELWQNGGFAPRRGEAREDQNRLQSTALRLCY